MKAEPLIKQRLVIDDNSFAELTLWRVPQSVKGSLHAFKYRLAFVADGICILRYDNEVGKGDHKHIGNVEYTYVFTTPQRLLVDFWNDVDAWRRVHG